MGRDTEKIIAINKFLQVLQSLNVKMNATKFIFKVSRRDRYPRTVKRAYIEVIFEKYFFRVFHVNKGNAKL